MIWYQASGKIILSVGGGQAGIKNQTTSNVIISVCKKTSKSFTDKGLEYYPLLNNVYTSNRISRLFWFGRGEAGIQKMRSLFFERSKSSGVPVTQPAGCGGESNELKEPTCLKAKSKMNKDSKRKFL